MESNQVVKEEKNKNAEWELSNTIKCNNICITGISEERNGGRNFILRNNAENFPNTGKESKK